MSSERQAFNDGFDKGFSKSLDKIAQLEEKNTALIAQVNGLLDEIDRWHEKGYLSVDPIGSIYYGRRKP